MPVPKLRMPPPSNVTTGEPSFRWRRIAFFGIVGYAFLAVPLLAFLPPIDDNAVKIAQSLIDMAGWAFLVYAAGAGAQDITAIVTTRSAKPYAENVQSVDAPPQAPTTVVSDKTTVTGGPVTNTAPPGPEPEILK